MKERSYPKVDAMIFRREWREAFKRGTGDAIGGLL